MQFSREATTRPKRQTRPPSYLQDYETDHQEHRFQPLFDYRGVRAEPRCEDGSYSPSEEGAAKMTPLAPPSISAGWPSKQWEITVDEWVGSPEQTLTEPQRRESSAEEDNRDYSTASPHHRRQQQSFPPYRSELEQLKMKEVEYERSKEEIRSELAELKDLKEEMKRRMGYTPQSTATSQQRSEIPPPTYGPPPPSTWWSNDEEEEEGEWPEPPPWPETEEEEDASPSTQPVSIMLEKLMSDLQLIKNRTMTPQGRKPRFMRPVPTQEKMPTDRRGSLRPGGPDRAPSLYPPSMLPVPTEQTYRGPKPSIPYFARRDPRDFARLKIALINLLPPDGTELFKYQILVDHLKLEEAKLIADSYLNSATPYSDTMRALSEKFGQPHQMALNRIAGVMDAPDVRRGDSVAFERFALEVQSLVGLLRTLGPEGDAELRCGSHVARLLSKLPAEQRADFRRAMFRHPSAVYTLVDFAEWLQYETWCHNSENYDSGAGNKDKAGHQKKRVTTVLHGTKDGSVSRTSGNKGIKSNRYCPYCESNQHYLSQCSDIQKLSKDQLSQWIKDHNRCWRCARSHHAAQCDLRKPCNLCQGKHLQVLHDVNTRDTKDTTREESCLVSTTTDQLYLGRPLAYGRVLLKVVQVTLHHGKRSLETYALLDDGSERTMLLAPAAQKLGLQGTPETLNLRTIRQDIQTMRGASVSFQISPSFSKCRRFAVNGAFTADRLVLAEQSYPIDRLQKQFKYLSDLPLHPFKNAQPLILIGTDNPHLITPIEPVRLGPAGAPAAVRTRLGWALQGPMRIEDSGLQHSQCLFTSASPANTELLRSVEKLWQTDVLPYQNEKSVTRSKLDQEAVELLKKRTERVCVDGILRYATPLLRKKSMPVLKTSPESVMFNLRSNERRLSKNPAMANTYQEEIRKLVQAGSVVKLAPQNTAAKGESWFIPHHMVNHNNKDRLVFNCSHQYQGLNLNDFLLPGPTLSASLIGVLLRFREHSVAISSDIKGMFHQVRLLPEDRPLLRFVWRDQVKDRPPDIYEWQVLPFGTTCSPCCATYALQRHVTDHSQDGEDVRFSVERCFYVDNWLQSLPSVDTAKALVDKLRALLLSAGFDLRQWSSNAMEVISHLPSEARSQATELWLTEGKHDPSESTLGLSWNPHQDLIGYKHRPLNYGTLTMRNIYKVLASQYDPLGYILPYTTRAKVLVRQLWEKRRDWDDPLLPPDVQRLWAQWEGELQLLPQVTLPRHYTHAADDASIINRQVHIFCDASEQVYGSVAYLRSEDSQGQIHLAFLLARSRVAPRRQLSIPRLELSAALTGAQLAKLLSAELTLKIDSTTLWTDSTTVLKWILSDSCRYKVFVGTRVTEIQDLTDSQSWRYVDSASNPADDITWGKSLQELSELNRWTRGPPFLLQTPDYWPTPPATSLEEEPTELRKSAFCGVTSTSACPNSESEIYKDWQELLESTAQTLQDAEGTDGNLSAEIYRKAERHIINKIQHDSFPEEIRLLSLGKPVAINSRLRALAPQLDEAGEIRVGGRLRYATDLELGAIHPIVLDPNHPFTRLLIQDYDRRLCHPGPERLFADIRRNFWILRGREAVRRHQSRCSDCRRWKAKPTVPQMADLPVARLRLFKPAFYSTGTDCFGPFQVRIGRRHEKRWGIIFKCLTTRAVHLDVLTHLDVDSFLMALRRFIARRGTPAEILSDQGTNFRGAERELQQAMAKMSPDLQKSLAKQRITFKFNPPGAPHFGGVWEREIRSVKRALSATVGSQPLPEEVLRTVLIEVEGILNSKPLGYVSSSIADPDPVTPNHLLMGRPDGSLPQVVYPATELPSRRRWRHSQVLADQFWSRFIREYLPNLQIRQKWQTTQADLNEDAVVMLMDPQLPRALWSIGRVTKVHPSADGCIRSADVKVKDRVYTRPVARMVVLPAAPEEAGGQDLSSKT